MGGMDNGNGRQSETNGFHEEVPVAESRPTPILSYVSLLAVIIVTIATIPDPFQPEGRPTLQHVWYYGWLTAVSTGLGIIPLIFIPRLNSYWIGVSNAIAAGMMIAASYSLFVEGCTFREPSDSSEISSEARTAIGALLGLAFILGTKQFLEQHEDLTVGGLAGSDARRALLVFFVMTLHSFSEGVGIGVSFGGSHGSELGVFISTSLAVHNVPEGLAIAVTLLPRGSSKISASLWAILTSIPQPLMAVPAYLFVHYFIPVLPVGLGFAGGAMLWVACFELLLEAYEDTNLPTTSAVSTISLLAMLYCQGAIDEGART